MLLKAIELDGSDWKPLQTHTDDSNEGASNKI